MDVQTITNQPEHSRTQIEFSTWIALPDKLGAEDISTVMNKSKFEKKWISISKNKDLPDYINSVTINIAEIDGKLYKIDGLIRKSLWDKGELEKPDTLNVTVHQMNKKSYDELVNILYPQSLKILTKKEVVDCYQQLGLSFKSARLKHGHIMDALQIALRAETRTQYSKRSVRYRERNPKVNIERAINTFKDELLILDNIDPDSKLFSTGVLSAALLMLTINPDNLQFFIKLNKKQGETKGKRINPIEGLLRFIALHRENQRPFSEGRLQIELCGKTVRAVQLWNTGQDSSTYWIERLNSTDFIHLIKDMKRIKKIHGVPDL